MMLNGRHIHLGCPIFIFVCKQTSLNTIQGIRGRGTRKEPVRTEDGPVGVLKAEKAKAAMVVVVPAEVAAAVLVVEKMVEAGGSGHDLRRLVVMVMVVVVVVVGKFGRGSG
jgi:hypothetical protein